MSDEQFKAYDFNNDNEISEAEFIEGELKEEIFTVSLSHPQYKVVLNEDAISYFGDIA